MSANPDRLYLLVHDECHWGMTSEGALRRYLFDADLLAAPNVVIIGVSATADVYKAAQNSGQEDDDSHAVEHIKRRASAAIRRKTDGDKAASDAKPHPAAATTPPHLNSITAKSSVTASPVAMQVVQWVHHESKQAQCEAPCCQADDDEEGSRPRLRYFGEQFFRQQVRQAIKTIPTLQPAELDSSSAPPSATPLARYLPAFNVAALVPVWDALTYESLGRPSAQLDPEGSKGRRGTCTASLGLMLDYATTMAHLADGSKLHASLRNYRTQSTEKSEWKRAHVRCVCVRSDWRSQWSASPRDSHDVVRPVLCAMLSDSVMRSLVNGRELPNGAADGTPSSIRVPSFVLVRVRGSDLARQMARTLSALRDAAGWRDRFAIVADVQSERSTERRSGAGTRWHVDAEIEANSPEQFGRMRRAICRCRDTQGADADGAATDASSAACRCAATTYEGQRSLTGSLRSFASMRLDVSYVATDSCSC